MLFVSRGFAYPRLYIHLFSRLANASSATSSAETACALPWASADSIQRNEELRLLGLFQYRLNTICDRRRTSWKIAGSTSI